MRAKPNRPVPVPTPLTLPFWDAARNRQLAIQRCQDCGHYYHPPISVCTQCYSVKLGFEPVSGQGRIAALTVMHDGRIHGFGECVPFAVIVVELAEQAGLYLVSNLLELDPEEARIGMAVVVDFEPMDGGFVLPQFKPAASR